jgi:hypothetical protein
MARRRGGVRRERGREKRLLLRLFSCAGEIIFLGRARYSLFVRFCSVSLSGW